MERESKMTRQHTTSLSIVLHCATPTVIVTVMATAAAVTVAAAAAAVRVMRTSMWWAGRTVLTAAAVTTTTTAILITATATATAVATAVAVAVAVAIKMIKEKILVWDRILGNRILGVGPCPHPRPGPYQSLCVVCFTMKKQRTAVYGATGILAI
jgi:hypothetical protein